MGKNINKSGQPIRVLIAPLDWGLGHTTRCIPIIKSLVKAGVEVVLAAERQNKALLQVEFPTLEILELKGYRVKYGKSGRFLILSLLFQVPRLMKAIRMERKWLQNIIKTRNIDVVISDNRYGLNSSDAYTIFITHQLFIESGNSFLNTLAQKINYSYINRFNECWVPDYETAPGLSGKLSHPVRTPRTTIKYTGPLSRLAPVTTKHEFDYLFLNSGPEPQRSIFEILLLQKASLLKGSICMVRGLPSVREKPKIKDVTIFNHLPAGELNQFISGARTIICRSGYSTIMDLRACGKGALLVPTPGQKEQEYLACILDGQYGFKTQTQENLNINEPEPPKVQNDEINSKTDIEDFIIAFLQRLPLTSAQ